MRNFYQRGKNLYFYSKEKKMGHGCAQILNFVPGLLASDNIIFVLLAVHEIYQSSTLD